MRDNINQFRRLPFTQLLNLVYIHTIFIYRDKCQVSSCQLKGLVSVQIAWFGYKHIVSRTDEQLRS